MCGDQISEQPVSFNGYILIFVAFCKLLRIGHYDLMTKINR